jgi:hypothetical protein
MHVMQQSSRYSGRTGSNQVYCVYGANTGLIKQRWSPMRAARCAGHLQSTMRSNIHTKIRV